MFKISVVLDYGRETRAQRFCRERQASSSRRCDIPVGDSQHAATPHCSSTNTDSSKSSVLSHSFGTWLIQQTSFFYSSYDKKCISSSLSVLQLHRQPLLPRHFGDTQIAISDHFSCTMKQNSRVLYGAVFPIGSTRTVGFLPS